VAAAAPGAYETLESAAAPGALGARDAPDAAESLSGKSQ